MGQNLVHLPSYLGTATSLGTAVPFATSQNTIEMTRLLYDLLLETVDQAEKSKGTDQVKHMLDRRMIQALSDQLTRGIKQALLQSMHLL